MSSATRPNQTSEREPAGSVISQRVELVDLGSDFPISAAELDALEQLLGADLHQLLQ
ncbi:hypothetical protein [Sphingorhabdus sp.]|uniref:hypothetical protein n=1 Tax=Sphingorhabdus sp. TaxID=1902408 RepID=UPI0038FCF961